MPFQGGKQPCKLIETSPFQHDVRPYLFGLGYIIRVFQLVNELFGENIEDVWNQLGCFYLGNKLKYGSLIEGFESTQCCWIDYCRHLIVKERIKTI